MDSKSMDKIVKKLKKADVAEYRTIPFWSWNDKLDKDRLVDQIKWMKKQGFGGYFMHARGGLTTEYLSDEWFDCIEACVDAGKKEGMASWAYDENGWPSGFVGGKLLEDPNNQDECLTYEQGEFKADALVSYEITEDELIRVDKGEEGKTYLNIYEHKSGSTADILNPEVVNKFIDATHNEYKKRLGKKFDKHLQGFFTDEPQYYRWGHPYTKMLPKYFLDKYKEDILDGLGLMFLDKNGYRAFRYKYWKAMQDLLLTNFSKNVYNWCDKHGVKLTGHYIEESRLDTQMWCCAGLMPLYEYEHIPGMDLLGRRSSASVAPKQVASVARQLGKKKVLTETFGLCGWGVTPRILKTIGESQFVHGINVMCEHLLPVAEHGQRKRDYPAHYSDVNPWIKENFKDFNDYFATLGYLIGESNEEVSVALFNPIRSLYFDYKRENTGYGGSPYDVDNSYMDLCEKLAKMNIPYHIIDETVMAKHAKVKNGKLIVGECEYDTIVFPKTLTMDKSSLALFNNFNAQGGKLLFTDGIPEYVEGEPFTYNLKSNITLEQIVDAQQYRVDKFDTPIRSCVRTFNGKKFIYAVNTDWKNSYTVKFDGNFKGFINLDIETLTTKKMATEINFRPGDSFVLFLSDEEIEKEEEKKSIVLDGEFSIIDSTDNFMTLDKIRYSTDGVNYSDKLRYMGIFFDLLYKRIQGDIYLKYEFKVKDLPKKVDFLTEDQHVLEVTVNGKKVESYGTSPEEKKLLAYDVKDYLVEGDNEIIVKINFYQADNVYYVMLADTDTESLKNCLTFDTTIEASFLKGDFGVYSEGGFKKGQEPKCLIAEDDFYIGKRLTKVKDTVSEGYPFFAGKMSFYKEFESDGEPTMLNLEGDFCLLYLKINGKEVQKSYFAERVDISDYLVKGMNTAEITVYTGNRNLLGPHHLKAREDSESVSRYSYELEGTWKDGVSSEERPNYSFVRMGLYKND